MSYFHTILLSASYLNTSSYGTCFAKSAFHSTNLCQGLPQGIPIKGSYLGSLLGFSVIGSSLGSWVVHMSLGAWKYIF